MSEVDVFRKDKYDFDGLVFHVRTRPGQKAEIAIRLVEHLAIAAGVEDGEDSSGRRAFKLQTPEQIVQRACEIADGLVNEFEKRGWMIAIPAYQDIPELKDAKEKV